MDVFADYNIPYHFKNAGENIAFRPEHITHTDTALAAYSMWRSSHGHYLNMINPDFEEIGIGYYNDIKTNDINYVYSTQIFGTQY